LTIYLTIKTASHIYKGITKVWNSKTFHVKYPGYVCFLFLHPSDLPLFTDKDISLIFIHVIYCWYVAYMWIRIPYSTIRQSQCTNCSFIYAENSVLQHQHSLNFPINRARQYSCYREARQYRSTGTFELTFYQKKRGRAFRN